MIKYVVHIQKIKCICILKVTLFPLFWLNFETCASSHNQGHGTLSVQV